MPDLDNTTVTLTELEFHKLLRFSELAAAVEREAHSVLERLRAEVAAAQKRREDYFDNLSKKYPGLDKTRNYVPNEETFELVPQELDAGK